MYIIAFVAATILCSSCQRCISCALVDREGQVLERYDTECTKRKLLKAYREECTNSARKLELDCHCKLARSRERVVE